MARHVNDLSVERAVDDDELAAAVARALGVDRERITVVPSVADAPRGDIMIEKRPHPGDFALRVGVFGVPELLTIDRVAFYRTLAAALDCKLLVDDGDVDPYTAMLVTPAGDMARVDLDRAALDGDDEALVIAGLHPHVDSDELPDVLTPASGLLTRGDALAEALDAASTRVPDNFDAFMAAYTPRVQDAEYELAQVLHELVRRPATAADERALRDASAILRRAFADAGTDGGPIASLVACATHVLAGPWDPNAPARLHVS